VEVEPEAMAVMVAAKEGEVEAAAEEEEVVVAATVAADAGEVGKLGQIKTY
jgi:hypothetical protein